jgi:hypothetical protein
MPSAKELAKRIDKLEKIAKGLEAMVIGHSAHLQGMKETILELPNLQDQELPKFFADRTIQAAKQLHSVAEETDPETAARLKKIFFSENKTETTGTN